MKFTIDISPSKIKIEEFSVLQTQSKKITWHFVGPEFKQTKFEPGISYYVTENEAQSINPQSRLF